MDRKTVLFCPSCGTKVSREGQLFCEECGARLDACQDGAETVFENAYRNSGILQAKPMKWYKFVVYFLLLISAGLNFINGITYITGRYLFDSGFASDGGLSYTYGYEIYEEFPSLRILDITYGIVLILLALYALFVRKMLVMYKKEAPKLFILYYVAGFIFGLISQAGCAVIVGDSIIELLVTTAISFVEIAIFIILNWIYFKKRSDCFVN